MLADCVLECYTNLGNSDHSVVVVVRGVPVSFDAEVTNNVFALPTYTNAAGNKMLIPPSNIQFNVVLQTISLEGSTAL